MLLVMLFVSCVTQRQRKIWSRWVWSKRSVQPSSIQWPSHYALAAAYAILCIILNSYKAYGILLYIYSHTARRSYAERTVYKVRSVTVSDVCHTKPYGFTDCVTVSVLAVK